MNAWERPPEYDDPPDPDDFGEDAEILIECDTCDGDGWQMWADGKMPCAECGGTGWLS
jgi:hypothetical protein